jgi:NAD(P)H-hydrate epimerase
MIGAPALVAAGALRAGAGLARIAAPDPVLSAVIVLCPSATGFPLPVDERGELIPHEVARIIDEQLGGCQCLVVGPGLGQGEGTRTAALRAIQQDAAPAVVDADALTALADLPELTRDFHAAAILTPHPGEFRRLAAALQIQHDPVDPRTRPAAAQELSQRLGCVTVLKGAGTVVSDGQRTWVNTSGSPALATGGTGDVLAGVIAGVVAQFVRGPSPGSPPLRGGDAVPPASSGLPLYDAARIAAYVHGRAGEMWAQKHGATGGLLAPELGEFIPAAIEELRSRA